MKKLFGYDSKLMQFLGTLCDLIFLNALFILCSIPIFTMGASWTGLYSGVRALRADANGGKSCYAAFFEGFKTGFLRVTVCWCSFFVVALCLCMVLIDVYIFQVVDPDAPVAMSIVGLVFVLLFMTMIPLFHSRFECKGFQLVRNVVVVIICNPIAAVIHMALTWVPLLVFFVSVQNFVTWTPLWVLGYYAVAAILGLAIFRYPFKMLENNFLESQEAAEESEESVEAEQ